MFKFSSTLVQTTSEHLKAFNKGIDLYLNNFDCPLENSAITDGWLCAKEIREVKSQALLASRQKFNIITEENLQCLNSH